MYASLHVCICLIYKRGFLWIYTSEMEIGDVQFHFGKLLYRQIRSNHCDQPKWRNIGKDHVLPKRYIGKLTDRLRRGLPMLLSKLCAWPSSSFAFDNSGDNGFVCELHYNWHYTFPHTVVNLANIAFYFYYKQTLLGPAFQQLLYTTELLNTPCIRHPFLMVLRIFLLGNR